MSNNVLNTSNGTEPDMDHLLKSLENRPKILSNILEDIGNTPLVKLNRIPVEEGIVCDMYAKPEYMEPGGSVKDRIAYRMVVEAEKKGILKPGYSTIIEPTSGNTGIGLALIAAVRGYRCIIVLPEKMSDEKVNTLHVLGAEIVRTPTEVPSWDPRSNLMVAQRLTQEIEGAVMLDQYNNPNNPLAHFECTAEEILWALDDNVDMVVIGAGTSGTVSGVGEKVKQRCPHCIVVGVDPYGSILATPDSANKSDVTYYEVEGVGYDFLPKVLDRSVIDQWVKTVDKDSFAMSRRLIKEEGLLAGGSAGAVMWAACQAAKQLKVGQKCVVLLPDGIRNYMTKFVSDQWMEARDFFNIPDNPQIKWWSSQVAEHHVRPVPSVMLHASMQEALDKLHHARAPVLAVLDAHNSVVGIVTANDVRKRLANHSAKLTDPLADFTIKKYYSVDVAALPPHTLGRVSRLLDISPFVLVLRTSSESFHVKHAVGMMTSEDLLHIATSTHANGN